MSIKYDESLEELKLRNRRQATVIANKRREIKELKKALNNAEERYDAAKDGMQRMEDHIHALEMKLASPNSMIGEFILTNTMSEQNVKLRDEISAMKEALSDSERQIEDLKEDSKTQIQKFQELLKEKNRVDECLDYWYDMCGKEKAKSSAKEAAYTVASNKLKKDIVDLKEHIDDLTKKLNEERNKCNRYYSRYLHMSDACNEKDEIIHDLAKERDELMEKVKLKEAANDFLRHQLEEAKEETFDKIKKEFLNDIEEMDPEKVKEDVVDIFRRAFGVGDTDGDADCFDQVNPYI